MVDRTELLECSLAVLRWVAGQLAVPELPRVAWLFLACSCFIFALLLLMYAFIKDVDPAELEVGVGLVRFKYRGRRAPPAEPSDSS